MRQISKQMMLCDGAHAGSCWWSGTAVPVHDLHPVRNSWQGGIPGILQPTGRGAQQLQAQDVSAMLLKTVPLLLARVTAQH